MISWLRKNWFLCVIVSLGLVWGIYNYFNNKTFLNASLSTIISILIAIIVSFYLVQRKNDLIREKEKIDRLIYKIQQIVLDDTFGAFGDENTNRKNLIMQRSVANKFEYLSNSFKRLNNRINNETKNDLKRANEEFNKFKEFYGNHYTDSDYMSKSYTEITNYKVLIDDYCDRIHIQLFEP